MPGVPPPPEALPAFADPALPAFLPELEAFPLVPQAKVEKAEMTTTALFTPRSLYDMLAPALGSIGGWAEGLQDLCQRVNLGLFG